MFYSDTYKEESGAVIVLTPSESKRLIGKGVAASEAILKAKVNGRIIINTGTTNAYVASEILGINFDAFAFTIGHVTDGKLGAAPLEKRQKPIILEDGVRVERSVTDVLSEFTVDDVYIKGANAVDPYGNAGVLMSSDTGGTIGGALGIINARGSNFLVPVGLEKLIPSVTEAASVCGQGRFKYSSGDSVGMMPLTNATIVTELDAIDILFPGVLALHVASGGISGSEGSVVLSLSGSETSVKEAFDALVKIKGEPPVAR